MKTIQKKLMIISLVAAQAALIVPTAHAGFGIYALGEDKNGFLPGTARVFGMTVATVGSMAVYTIQVFGGPNLGGWLGVIGATLLDADGSLNQDTLSQTLANQYPFPRWPPKLPQLWPLETPPVAAV